MVRSKISSGDSNRLQWDLYDKILGELENRFFEEMMDIFGSDHMKIAKTLWFNQNTVRKKLLEYGLINFKKINRRFVNDKSILKSIFV